ncbi:exocyst complex component 1 isoform X6 [Silurus meridionalis]|nr:exocyst complex component 1 isoform X6 [Silurus meridionalis]
MMEVCEYAISNAEAFAEKLSRELQVLDGANIQSIMASEKQVNILMQLLDEALSEVDAIEGKLLSYEEMLQSVKEQMDQISQSNRLIQISKTNNGKLLDEIQFLVNYMDLSKGHIRALQEGDLSSPKGIEACINASEALLQCMSVALRPESRRGCRSASESRRGCRSASESHRELAPGPESHRDVARPLVSAVDVARPLVSAVDVARPLVSAVDVARPLVSAVDVARPQVSAVNVARPQLPAFTKAAGPFRIPAKDAALPWVRYGSRPRTLLCLGPLPILPGSAAMLTGPPLSRVGWRGLPRSAPARLAWLGFGASGAAPEGGVLSGIPLPRPPQ